jgi:hypothetical protein
MIPGAPARHAIISDECRLKGDVAVIEEAIARIRETWLEVSKGIPIGHGYKFHVALTVERPAKGRNKYE